MKVLVKCLWLRLHFQTERLSYVTYCRLRDHESTCKMSMAPSPLSDRKVKLSHILQVKGS